MRPSRIHVTVDVVIFTSDRVPRVLLVRRKNDPFRGRWAIPGGFVEPDESLEAAAKRELHEETGLSRVAVRQLHTFGDPGRDPRGRTVTIAYLAMTRSARTVRGSSDAADARWWPTDALPPLAFDHSQILHVALERHRAMGLERARRRRSATGSRSRPDRRATITR